MKKMKLESLKVKMLIQLANKHFVSSQLSTCRTTDSSALQQLSQLTFCHVSSVLIFFLHKTVRGKNAQESDKTNGYVN